MKENLNESEHKNLKLCQTMLIAIPWIIFLMVGLRFAFREIGIGNEQNVHISMPCGSGRCTYNGILIKENNSYKIKYQDGIIFINK
ncbi:hypothetical protein ACWU37_21895 (plasmid) [Photobacterium damselae subsp. damselae]